MTFRLATGYLLAVCIGVFCQLSNVPVPAPPAIVGALIVLSMTSGYVLMDLKMSKPSSDQTPR